MDARQSLGKARAAFPHLAIARLRRLGAGWANECWLSDDGIVFRFTRTEAGRAALRKEAALMPALSPTLPLAAPDFRHAAPDAGVGGYPLVPGVPLPALAPAHAAAIAHLLGALHGFPAARAARLGAPGGDPEAWRAELAVFGDSAQVMLAPHWTAADAAKARAHIASFVQDDRNFAFVPALIHRDLAPEHLLADPASGRLTGVIDFEDACIGDPAFDFAGLGDAAAPTFARYRGPADAGFPARAAFYRSLAPLHRMRYGTATGHSGHIRAGLAAWRRAGP